MNISQYGFLRCQSCSSSAPPITHLCGEIYPHHKSQLRNWLRIHKTTAPSQGFNYLHCSSNVSKRRRNSQNTPRRPSGQKSNPDAIIKPYELDLSKHSSVLSFCKKFSTEVQTLDLAVMNACAGIFKFDILPTGNETMLQVNFLSTALLSLHLLPILQRGSKPDHPSHFTFFFWIDRSA